MRPCIGYVSINKAFMFHIINIIIYSIHINIYIYIDLSVTCLLSWMIAHMARPREWVVGHRKKHITTEKSRR